jgi:hypothetical protein
MSMRSLSNLFLPAILFVAAFFPFAARANSITSNPVTGSAAGFSGSGTLIATDNGNGSSTITSISGTGINGLIPTGTFNSNDNLLFPGNSALVDTSGFSFTDVQNTTAFQVNLFASNGNYYAYLLDSDGFSETVPVTFAVGPASTPGTNARFRNFARLMATSGAPHTYTFAIDTPSTPEPSGLILLGTGLAAVIALTRRRSLLS